MSSNVIPPTALPVSMEDMMAEGVMMPSGIDDPMAMLQTDFPAVNGGVLAASVNDLSQLQYYSVSQQNLVVMDGAAVNGDVGGDGLSTIPPTMIDGQLNGIDLNSGMNGASAQNTLGGSSGAYGEVAYNLPENAVYANPAPIQSAPTNMRILIATDCHLGVRDREPLVSDDALRTFEEVMQIAQHKDVDMMLMAGDLFHQNRPSRQTVCRTVEILEKYCLGPRPVAVRFLSNPDEIFANVSDDPLFRRPNWEDPNINIELPIFSIHGNHDDPIGPKNLCELDALHTQRLINYFGKVGDVGNIEVKPVLLEKNGTFLALYGLGSMKDERLYHLLRKGMVKFIRPEPFECNGVRVAAEDMYSVLLFHQNRVPRGSSGTNHIPEYMLPEWMDLIVWGHEHDCVPRVVETPYVEELTGRITMRRVLQPGSTCSTSLSEAEALPKHVFMLELVGREWNVEAIKLQSVRPFFIQDVDLARLNLDAAPTNAAGAGDAGGDDAAAQPPMPVVKPPVTASEDSNKRSTAVEDALAGLVEKYIVLAQQQHESQPRTPREPLVRLRVHFGKKDQMLNQKRFGQRFVGRVACPDDILHAIRRRGLNELRDGMVSSPNRSRLSSSQQQQQPALSTTSMDDFIRNYFEQQAAKPNGDALACQNIDLFLESLKLQIDKDDKKCVSDMMVYEAAQMKAAALEACAPATSSTSTTSVDDLTKILDECFRTRQDTLSVDDEVKKYNAWRQGKPDELKAIPEQTKRMSQLRTLDKAAQDLKKVNAAVQSKSYAASAASQRRGAPLHPPTQQSPAAAQRAAVAAAHATRGGARGGATTAAAPRGRPPAGRGATAAAAQRTNSASRNNTTTAESDDDIIEIEDGAQDYAPPTKRGRISGASDAGGGGGQAGFFGASGASSQQQLSQNASPGTPTAGAGGTRITTRASTRASARAATGRGGGGGGTFFTAK